MRLLPFLLALAAFVALPAHAATLRATPETFAAVAQAARDGDTIVLARGYYGDVYLPVADHADPVEIDASQTRARSLTIRGTAGWTWRGGTIDSPLPPAVWRNVMIDNARRIEIAGVTMTGGHTGVLVTRGSEDIVLRGNIFTGLQSDGINVATAKRVSMIGNTCVDFRPIPPVWADGKLVKDGTHPDCIMLWSEAGKEPTSDILILGNRALGLMQGITTFYHPSLGRPKVERVRVWNNTVAIRGFWHGIYFMDTPGADLRFNTVATLPNSTALGRPDIKTTAWLRADPDAVRCGNTVNGIADPSC